VIGDKPVRSYQQFLKYSKRQKPIFVSPLTGDGVRKRSIAMKKLFSEITSVYTLFRQPSEKRQTGGKKSKP
jgi:hypothetical protein